MFSLLEEYHECTRGYLEYIGGCLVHKRNIMIHVGGYHEYTGECSVHQTDITIYVGGYDKYVGDVQYVEGRLW